jgi:hypothetical protein
VWGKGAFTKIWYWKLSEMLAASLGKKRQGSTKLKATQWLKKRSLKQLSTLNARCLLGLPYPLLTDINPVDGNYNVC